MNICTLVGRCKGNFFFTLLVSFFFLMNQDSMSITFCGGSPCEGVCCANKCFPSDYTCCGDVAYACDSSGQKTPPQCLQVNNQWGCYPQGSTACGSGVCDKTQICLTPGGTSGCYAQGSTVCESTDKKTVSVCAKGETCYQGKCYQ